MARTNESRGAVFLAQLNPELSHALYNNGYNLDKEGSWDGVKWNVGYGLNIRTDNRTDTTIKDKNISALYINNNRNVGIGTTDPKSLLSVAGGLAIGSSYAKTDPASTNYLIVEGNVGIGTTNPKTALSFGNVDKEFSNVVGITWHNDNAECYGIYRTKGKWSSPDYQQLQVKWLTGIVLNPGTDYGKSYVDIQGKGLRVTAGNVGIGISDPGSYKINVAGSTRLGETKEYGSEVLLSIAPGTVQFDANNVPGGRLTIKGDTGNVGIGTAGPGARLEVAGTLTATQNNEEPPEGCVERPKER